LETHRAHMPRRSASGAHTQLTKKVAFAWPGALLNAWRKPSLVCYIAHVMHESVHYSTTARQYNATIKCKIPLHFCMQAVAVQASKVPAGEGGVHFHGCEVHGQPGEECSLWSANARAGKHQGPSITYWRQLGNEALVVQGNGRQEAEFSPGGDTRRASIHEDVKLSNLQIKILLWEAGACITNIPAARFTQRGCL